MAYQVLNLSSGVTLASPFTLHALFAALERQTKPAPAAYGGGQQVKETPRSSRPVGRMAAGSSEEDAHMEELLDQGLGMEETDQGLLRRPSLRESYHSDSLLAPDADFITGREESATMEAAEKR